MATHVAALDDMPDPIVRRKTVSVSNDSSMMAVHDYGEYGQGVTDEPIAHGGTGEGPSPLQAVLGALCGCEAVTFNRTSKDMGFSYDGIEFEAEFTGLEIAGEDLDAALITSNAELARVNEKVVVEFLRVSTAAISHTPCEPACWSSCHPGALPSKAWPRR